MSVQFGFLGATVIEGQRSPTMNERAALVHGSAVEARAKFLEILNNKSPENISGDCCPVWMMEPFAIDSNRVACRSALLAGLQGDSEAQLRYEETRLFSLATVPSWLSQLVLERFNEGYSSITNQQIDAWMPKLSKGLSYEPSDSWRVRSAVDSFIAWFGLVQSPTYDCALEYQAALAGREYRNEKRFERIYSPLRGENSVQVVTCYSPLEDSPFGAVARRELKSLVQLMFRGLVLDDMLCALNFDLSARSKCAILAKNERPAWELSSSRSGQNLVKLAQAVNDRSLQGNPQQIAQFVEQNLFAKNPLSSIETGVFTTDEPASSGNIQCAVADIQQGQRLRIADALEARGVGENLPYVARMLHGLLRRGAIAEAQLLERVASEDDLVALPQRIYQESYRSLAAERRPSLEETISEDEHSVSYAPEVTGHRVSPIQLHYTDSFREWESSIPEVYRQIIGRRLSRLSRATSINDGIGDWSRIKGCEDGRPLFELRIHSGPGLRIIVLRHDTTKLSVVWGYTKKDQDHGNGIAGAIRAARNVRM